MEDLNVEVNLADVSSIFDKQQTTLDTQETTDTESQVPKKELAKRQTDNEGLDSVVAFLIYH